MQQNFSLQHLDLQPEKNLLILSGRVKVGDFGLVKDIQDAAVWLVSRLDARLRRGPRGLHRPPQPAQRPVHLGHCLPGNAHRHFALLGTQSRPLATRHQCRPRLAPLPPEDRPIIARALAKPGRTLSVVPRSDPSVRKRPRIRQGGWPCLLAVVGIPGSAGGHQFGKGQRHCIAQAAPAREEATRERRQSPGRQRPV